MAVAVCADGTVLWNMAVLADNFNALAGCAVSDVIHLKVVGMWGTQGIQHLHA
jgi:hypothetical protein